MGATGDPFWFVKATTAVHFATSSAGAGGVGGAFVGGDGGLRCSCTETAGEKRSALLLSLLLLLLPLFAELLLSVAFLFVLSK